MRPIILAGLIVAVLPRLALAGDIIGGNTTVALLDASISSQDTTVQPPSGEPHAFTAAPVPNVGGPAVSPANRFGNADDAGPINSTPLSSNLSPSIGVGPNARSVEQTDPTAEASPSLAGHD